MKAVFKFPSEFYAAQYGEASDRLLSASGGIVPALGRHIIKQGGIVYGVRWDKDFRAVFTSAETEEELDAFRGSKYVQSHISPEIYNEIAANANSGRLVMAVALPCQIAGILTHFSQKPDNLITVDLICHGLPPESAFASELKHYRHLVRKADDIRFRSNDEHDYHLTFWNSSKCLYSKLAYSQPYFGAYLASINLKEACYKCQFARPERIADLTVGDYIVSGDHLSAVCVNSPKAAAILNSIKEADPKMHLEARPYEERLAYGPSLRHPSSAGRERKTYLRLLRVFSPATAIRIALWRRFLSVSIVTVKRALKH